MTQLVRLDAPSAAGQSAVLRSALHLLRRTPPRRSQRPTLAPCPSVHVAGPGRALQVRRHPPRYQPWSNPDINPCPARNPSHAPDTLIRTCVCVCVCVPAAEAEPAQAEGDEEMAAPAGGEAMDCAVELSVGAAVSPVYTHTRTKTQCTTTTRLYGHAPSLTKHMPTPPLIGCLPPSAQRHTHMNIRRMSAYVSVAGLAGSC